MPAADCGGSIPAGSPVSATRGLFNSAAATSVPPTRSVAACWAPTVPIWIRSSICAPSALKTMPRAPMPQQDALRLGDWPRSLSGSSLDIRNRAFASSSGRICSLFGKHDRVGLRLRDVAVEQQELAVVGRERLERLGSRLGVAVGRLAVGQVDDHRREAARGGWRTTAPRHSAHNRGPRTSACRSSGASAGLRYHTGSLKVVLIRPPAPSSTIF